MTELHVINIPPNKEKLIKQIKNNFPLVWLNAPIWLAYEFKQKSDGTFTKPPLSRLGHTVKDDELGMTFDRVCEDGYPGIKINKHTTLIAFDIDDKDAKLGKRQFDMMNISEDFRSFIIDVDSYMEYSPSGCGLRIFMICIDKLRLPGRVNLLEEKCIGGELFMNSGYVTVTGNQLSGESIKEIEPYQLKQWYVPGASGELTKAEVIDIPTDFKEQHPTILLVEEALKYCKLNQCDRVKDAYKAVMNQEYNHYDYWLKILAACHYYAEITGQMNEVTQMIMDWSQTDELSFESDEDVITHWSSFSNKKDSVTYSTLMKFAKLLKFQWPEEKYNKDGSPSGKPIVTSLVNFEYLIDYYSIKIYSDIFARNLYITGDNDVINKFFAKRGNLKTHFGMVGPMSVELLEAGICSMAQQNEYSGVAVNSINQLFKSYIVSRITEFNMLEKWTETLPKELPEDMVEKNTDITKSNLEYLMSCIEFNHHQSAKLAKLYFETLFFEMMMPLYNPKRILSHRSFMLILTGPENCRKTTFWSMLFPANLRRQFVTNSTETLGGAKSLRDFNSSLVTSVLVIVDEFEIFYNKNNESLFKSLVTADEVDYIPIYGKVMIKENRNAVITGTTNQRSLSFEQDSNRRFAIVDVKWIDTDAMTKINWHHFYRHYIAEGKKAIMNGVHSWKLSPEIISMQYEENENFRAQSNKEIMLREVFDFDMETHKNITQYDMPGIQHNKILYKLKDITGTLKQYYPEVYFPPAEMKHLLKRLCGKYTHTTNKEIPLSNAVGKIKDGAIHQSGYTMYVMPPLLTNFS